MNSNIKNGKSRKLILNISSDEHVPMLIALNCFTMNMEYESLININSVNNCVQKSVKQRTKRKILLIPSKSPVF